MAYELERRLGIGPVPVAANGIAGRLLVNGIKAAERGVAHLFAVRYLPLLFITLEDGVIAVRFAEITAAYIQFR